ncbi:O-antigen polymerase [Mesobacillus subterraneus]|uniref:O-antigen polymerase n=1 Tax=Mesobacillus subterraneus TaxID=285983 RepID=UPI001CFDEA3B|nr:O-antigen polymerase [Mesobacillus subterraneus]WLR55468.1 O-antigen polymerase [Mesobacillus subterraneus]
MHLGFLIIYICLFFCFIYFLRSNYEKTNISGAYAGITFGFLLYYALIPILLIILEGKFLMANNFGPLVKYVYQKDDVSIAVSIIVITFGFFAFHLGYVFSSKYKLRISNFQKRKIKYKIHSINSLKIFTIIGYGTFLIGGISFLILINSLGGILNALTIGEKFRGFGETALSDFVGVNTALLFIPSRLITVTPIIFYFLLINRKNKMDKIVFSLSFPFAILFFLFNAGRAPLIIYLLAFLYIFLKRYTKKVWIKIFALGIISLPLLDVLDKFFIFLSTNQWYEIKVNYLSYIYQFTHPFKSVVNLRGIVTIEDYYFGSSVFRDIFSILPKINFDPLFFEVSEYFYGTNWSSIGGVPTDLLTYGYFQMGIPGVISLLLMVGYLTGKIDKTLLLLPQNKSRDFISVVMATNISGVIPSADLSSLLRGNVMLISISIILFLTYKQQNKNK